MTISSIRSTALRVNHDEVGVELRKALIEAAERRGDDRRRMRPDRTRTLARGKSHGAMLRRQQAEAVIAARKKLVEGAVTMVEMALTQLSEKGVVDLDDERKAVMVSNLMVVLCGETRHAAGRSTPGRFTEFVPSHVCVRPERPLPSASIPRFMRRSSGWTAAELRSANAEIEVLLREALARRAAWPIKPPSPRSARPAAERGKLIMLHLFMRKSP